MVEITCEKYDEVGDCIEWKIKEGNIYGKIKENAKICAPKLTQQAQQILKKGKVFLKNEDEN